MSEELTQAVTTETNPPAQPGAAGTQDARNDDADLDTLLSQFDESKSAASDPKPKPEPKAGAENDLGTLAEQMRGTLSEIQQATFRRDMDVTLKAVRGDLPPDYFDDTFVEAWLDAQARSDPRLAAAWQSRQSNPKQFQKVVDGLSRTFAKKYGKLPDKQATEDREAVTAAVRGASTKAPEGKAPDFSGMSNAQYREAIKKDFGFDPGVG